jgi:hypothetical protein
MPDEKKSPLEQLTPEQQARLQNLSADISYDKLTVSFSLDERDLTGRKRSSFFSLGVSRKGSPDGPLGFTQDEIRVVRCLVSKQVVATVYDDAVKRGMLPRALANGELRPILDAYDSHIAKLMEGTHD